MPAQGVTPLPASRPAVASAMPVQRNAPPPIPPTPVAMPDAPPPIPPTPVAMPDAPPPIPPTPAQMPVDFTPAGRGDQSMAVAEEFSPAGQASPEYGAPESADFTPAGAVSAGVARGAQFEGAAEIPEFTPGGDVAAPEPSEFTFAGAGAAPRPKTAPMIAPPGSARPITAHVAGETPYAAPVSAAVAPAGSAGSPIGGGASAQDEDAMPLALEQAPGVEPLPGSGSGADVFGDSDVELGAGARGGIGTGTEISTFRITGKIADGGMGMIFEGIHTLLHNRVAIKTLLPSLFSDQDMLERFYREVETVAQMHHPNIIQVLDAGVHAGMPYLVMDFVDGQALHDLIQRQGIQPNLAVFLLAEIANALHSAHSAGVLHRDLKPQNIIVSRDGRAFLTDFGVALDQKSLSGLTQHGQVVGTPAYVAPELVHSKPFDHRCDVYGLAATLYEAVTRRPPFNADSVAAIFHLVAHEEPIPPREIHPGCPVALERIIQRGMAKDPDERYQSCADLENDMRHYLAGKITSEAQARQRVARLIT